MSTVMEYDINSDGTKEVIIRTGEYASDMLYSIYTAQNGEAMWIGDIGASHSVLYYDENGRLLKQIAHMNCETVYAISVINGTIIETELYSNGMVDSYSVPGIKLESYFLSEFFETIEE